MNKKIITLDWKPYHSQFSNDYYADTPMGSYVIFKDMEKGCVLMVYNSITLDKTCQSYNEAKEYCQQDFETRLSKCYD